ncbi:MAG: RNA methyltransferase [Chitinophagales bacterium]
MLPVDFINGMRKAFPEDVEALLAALEYVPAVSIRYNPRFSGTGIFETESEVPWCSNAIFLKERPSFTLDPAFHAGAYYVQESSSMFLEQLWKQHVPANKPLQVLDLCAAPGGKSTHLLSLMGNHSILVANEPVANRNTVLRQNLAKWGMVNHIVTQNEPEDFLKAGSVFDVVLIDAPCSGEGMFRKDKNARKEWSLRNVEVCEVRQSKILENARRLLKPGGLLIYSTCTFEDVENDLQVERLQSEFDCLRLSNESVFPEILRTRWGYAFLPHRVKGEGFYISCWKKRQGVESPLLTSRTPVKMASFEKLTPMVSAPEMVALEVHDSWRVFPKEHLGLLHHLREHLFIKKAGAAAGAFKGLDFIPDHELALTDLVSSAVPRIEVSETTALQFLKGNAISVSAENKGWSIITFRNLQLGWVKVLPNRVNNYYPKNWRILMDVA